MLKYVKLKSPPGYCFQIGHGGQAARALDEYFSAEATGSVACQVDCQVDSTLSMSCRL